MFSSKNNSTKVQQAEEKHSERDAPKRLRKWKSALAATRVLSRAFSVSKFSRSKSSLSKLGGGDGGSLCKSNSGSSHSLSQSSFSSLSQFSLSSSSSDVPADVPEGYFPVYVGQEKQRFVIKLKLLNHSAFKILLEAARNEFGYAHEGVITFPCSVNEFKKVLKNSSSRPSACVFCEVPSPVTGASAGSVVSKPVMV